MAVCLAAVWTGEEKRACVRACAIVAGQYLKQPPDIVVRHILLCFRQARRAFLSRLGLTHRGKVLPACWHLPVIRHRPLPLARAF